MPALAAALAFAASLAAIRDLHDGAALAVPVLVVWALAVALLPRPRGGLRPLLAAAIAVRAILLFTEPTLSDDLYRYLWEGRVVGAGDNPFLYPPSDPHWAFAATDWIHVRVNHAAVSTIYPPVALWSFALVSWIHYAPITAQGFAALVDVLLVAVLYETLVARHRSTDAAWLYALHPLGAVEAASNGHLESLGLLFTVLAIRAWERGRPGVVWAMLGGGTKLLPFAMVPALLRARRGWVELTAGAVVLALLTAPFVGAGATLVRGFTHVCAALVVQREPVRRPRGRAGRARAPDRRSPRGARGRGGDRPVARSGARGALVRWDVRPPEPDRASLVRAVGVGTGAPRRCAQLDGARVARAAVVLGAGRLRSGGLLARTMVAPLDPVPAVLPGPLRGVRVARDPAGALGEWSRSDAVAVTISDRTRPLDPLPALEALNERLSDMGVIVGLGLHRKMTPDEIAPWSAFAPLQHDADDAVATKDVRGVPGLVHRAIADAAWCVSVGVAEPHQYAGFSGGHKGVAIGCGGRATIAALHARDRVMDPGVRIGAVAGNPFREIVDELGAAARCVLALVWVPAAKVWIAGEPRAVVAEASRLGAPWYPVARTYPNVLLQVPPSKGASFYQASRAATYLALSPSPPIEPGARLHIEAPCPEGLGAEEGFRAALESCRPPWTALLDGPEPTGAGAQRAVILALIAKRYRVTLGGVIDPEPFRAVGIDASSERVAPGADWLVVDEPFVRIPQR